MDELLMLRMATPRATRSRSTRFAEGSFRRCFILSSLCCLVESNDFVMVMRMVIEV
jgi:hypothetical protein